ncbi:MAG TPA: NADH-quinone oxidoreductase subunit L [Thermomicrobiaceae bacterium]|nr:NADH-quinone oxidoreductase subunit L [Thermomicrobiaceae bacterium]
MANWLFLIPLAPLVAAVVNFVLGRWFIRDRAHWLGILGVGVSFVLSVIVFAQVHGGTVPLSQHLYTWIPAGDFQIPVTLTVDQLTAVMLLVVSGVSLLVHVYSVGYMQGDTGFYRFFSYLPLFVFSMLMLVLASNYLLLFVFWEGVGLCSYLLIGFWFRRLSAANAAKKAFIVNRVGDLGFGIGIMFIFVKVGSLDYSRVFAAVPQLPQGAVTLIALLLFTGAIGKSAQIPLFVWLPDAMEGPTPVSALIHAATMVTAGIFMVARSFPIFSASHTAMLVVAIVGAATAFVAATIGVTQYDIKKVIAYSTVSQLGYMAFALGVGAWAAAIFHLMTHAFFKGLLFLGAGSVIHGMHDEQDMRFMGGLKKFMPITFWTFLIGAAANAGIVPLAGFWSKDETIVGAWAGGYPIVAIVGLIAAFFTSVYMFRVVFLTFLGEERFDHDHVHPHESPPWMTVPLLILAIGAGLAGFLGFPPEHGFIQNFLGPVFSVSGAAVEHHVSLTTTLTFGVISTLIALSGVFLTWRAYVTRTLVPDAIAARLGPLYRLSFRKWYFDEIYERLVVHPLYLTSVFLWRVVDVHIIDGTVNGVAGVVSFTSERWRRAQTGLLANYALAIALGAVVIVAVYLIIDSSLIR